MWLADRFALVQNAGEGGKKEHPSQQSFRKIYKTSFIAPPPPLAAHTYTRVVCVEPPTAE